MIKPRLGWYGGVFLLVAGSAFCADHRADSSAIGPNWSVAPDALVRTLLITKPQLALPVEAAPKRADPSLFISTMPPLTIAPGKTTKAGRRAFEPLLLRSDQGLVRSVSLANNQLVFTSQPDPGKNYRLVAATDFDGSGTADLVYQDITQGEFGSVRWWSNFTPATEQFVRSVKVAWDAQVVGDLDGDGRGDMVWRYMLPGSNDTGVSYIWFRNADGSVQVRKRGGAPLNWNMVGAADINGDGAADLAYISPDGQIRILVAMPQRTCANFVAGNMPSGFKALRFADMLGLGNGDLLVRNPITGENRLLSMSAIGVALPPPAVNPDDPNASCTPATQSIVPVSKALPTTPTAWQLYGIADLNNDGAVDLIWLQPDGTLTVWLMNAAGVPTVIASAGSAPRGFMPFPTPPFLLKQGTSACVTTVKTGFNGNINAIYGGSGGDAPIGGGGRFFGGLGGGIFGSSDGEAGEETDEVGGGVSEGKVLGGMLTVNRFSDGQLLGSALTDATAGLVTLRSCASDLPLLLTVTGQPGARYYDEGTNSYVSFGSGQVLHALVDSLAENVGVSALTEAAYQYAIANFGQAPKSSADQVSQKAIGTLNLTKTQVKAANQAMLGEINRLLPTVAQLSSLTALATPIDATSSANALPDNRYGIAALVTGALARSAARYSPGSTAPALEMTARIARDLADGRINGYGADGATTASRLGGVYYDVTKFPIVLDGAGYSIAQQFSQNSLYQKGIGLTDITWAGNLDTSGGLGYGCYTQLDKTALLRDGTLNVLRATPAVGQNCVAQFDDPIDTVAGSSGATLIRGFATNVVKVDSKARMAFIQKSDGTVWSWGQNLCGVLGIGQTGGTAASPLQVLGLRNITSIAVGNLFAIARDTNGEVWTWGSAIYGVLGVGSSGFDIAVCDVFNGSTSVSRGASFPANHRPRKIAGLSGIVMVAADQLTALALDTAGRVYQWGLVGSPADINAIVDAPVLVAGLDSVVMLATANRMNFALRKDGTVWGWGANTARTFGDGTSIPVWSPRQVFGMSDIVQIAGDSVGGTVALRRDGNLYMWDYLANPFPTLAAPTNVCPPRPAGTPRPGCPNTFLPRVRHIYGTGARIIVYGITGEIYSLWAGLSTFDGVDTAALR